MASAALGRGAVALSRLQVHVSEEPDVLYKRLIVRVKAHERPLLDSYEFFITRTAQFLNIPIHTVYEPRRKIERLTVLKSVHIYKKHRVQYEMRTHFRVIELKYLTGSTANVYLEYIQRNLPEGVAMEVTRRRRGMKRADIVKSLSKRQRKHLKQFGEEHPVTEGSVDRGAFARPAETLLDEGDSSASDEVDEELEAAAAPSHYQQLIGLLGGNEADPETSDEEEEEEEEEAVDDSAEEEEEEEDEGEDEEEDDVLSTDAEEGSTEANRGDGKGKRGSTDSDAGSTDAEDEAVKAKLGSTKTKNGVANSKGGGRSLKAAQQKGKKESPEVEAGDLAGFEGQFVDRVHAKAFSLDTVVPVQSGAEEEKVEGDVMQVSSDDPFVQHLAYELEPGEVKTLLDRGNRSTEIWPCLGQLHCSWSLEKQAGAPRLGTGAAPLALHPPLERTWRHVNAQAHGDGKPVKPDSPAPFFTPLQQELWSLFTSYRDLFYPERSPLGSGEDVRRLYCLHVLNHVLKANGRVLANNGDKAEDTNDVDDDDEFRDQGLTRPKVLVVVPTRDAAWRVVTTLVALLGGDGREGAPRVEVSHRARFTREFGRDPGEEQPHNLRRPDDYLAIFSGNNDDHFRFGMALLKRGVRLYAPFYASDVVVASPLGLRTVLGAPGEATRDFDFLSSIELLVLDQTDVYLMQNWEHVMHLAAHVNLQPLEPHGVDFSRVRPWSLDGHARHYRQTLLLSALPHPLLHALVSRHASNYRGQVQVRNTPLLGSISQVVVQLPHVFQRIEADSATEIANARFAYFVEHVLPQYRDAVMAHTMVFVPSYFDYVRLRNHLAREGVRAAHVCEYTPSVRVVRARKSFLRGVRPFLLYTERFHFYKRYSIRGVRHLIFYELPTYPHFYSEVCNMLRVASAADAESRAADAAWTCTVLYSRYEATRLAAVVGAARAAHMLASSKKTHLFVTGDDSSAGVAAGQA
ncbi:unnamed protein product [Lampetra fluviatilis]